MSIELDFENTVLKIVLKGDCIAYSDDELKARLFSLASSSKTREIVFYASELGAWDSSLLVIVFEILKRAKKNKTEVNLDSLPVNLRQLANLALKVDRKPSHKELPKSGFLESLGLFGISLWQDVKKGSLFIVDVFKSCARFVMSKAVVRMVDLGFALEDCSYKAIGIVSLVSFMVGLILAFVGAIQLQTFGAEIYVASLVAVGMIRIMGAIMMGIIMAGRTGASYAATIGTMQVNEEVDALKTMGIPVIDYLVLPKIVSLLITMPVLTILADFMGIFGGAVVGVFGLGISLPEYYEYTISALSMNNFIVGLLYSFVYAFIIAICGCYYGINCGRNADSVGLATTKAVVSAIIWMIVATGFLTVLFKVLGI